MQREQKTKSNKVRSFLFSLLSAFFVIVSAVNFSQQSNIESDALDWDPTKWIMCSIGESGRDVLKAMRTEYIPFLLSSKSAIAHTDNPKYNVYNGLLKVAGYQTRSGLENEEQNPFDQFGMLGLSFSSYRGEWKYFDVNPCLSGDRQEPISTNFGQFYETRKEPLSSHSERESTKDIRTKEFAKGTGTAFAKAFSDRIANGILTISKFTVTLTIAMVSLSFTDISSLIGLDSTFQQSTVLKLYNNFFQPLVVITFLFTAVYILYNGIIKGEYRNALINGIVKTFVSFIIAIVIVSFPQSISLPNKIATFGQAILVSSAASSIGPNDGDDLCHSEVGLRDLDVNSDDFLKKASDNMKSIVGCRMWSEFIFKPFVLGQFGTKYEELDSLSNENSDWVGSPKVKLGNRTIENWGLFHVSVLSGKHQPIDSVDSPYIGPVHKDYYRIVDGLSNYNESFVEVELGEDIEDVVEYTQGYPEVEQTIPTEQWVFWNGSRPGNRIAYAVISVFTSSLGSAGPLIFSLASAVYGVGLSILVSIAPIFLLLGCWGGKGNQILMQYLGTVLSTMLKKMLTSLLVVISIAFSTSAINLVNDVGYIQAILTLIIITIALVKNKEKIIDKLSQINIGQLNTEHFTKNIRSIKQAGKSVGMLGVSGVVGARASVKAGGTAYQGAAAGISQYIRNKSYGSKLGRTAATVYETGVQGRRGRDESNRYCVSCGVKLEENSIAYVDENNNYWCEMCASAESFEGLTEVYLDNEKDNSYEVTKEGFSLIADYDGMDMNGVKESNHITLSELSQENFYDDSEENWEIIKENIQSRINDSVAIVHNDIKKVKDNNGTLRDMYIPELIRSRVNPNDLRRAVQKNDLDGYANIIKNAYEDWYRDVSKQRYGIAKSITYRETENDTRTKEEKERIIKKDIENMRKSWEISKNGIPSTTKE